MGGPIPTNFDLKSEVGPVYNVETKHKFNHGFVNEIEKKTIKGPVYEVERKHKFEKGFSCTHRPPSPTPGPVRGEFKSKFKHPITLPSREQRSKSVGYEVEIATDFKEKETRSNDLKTMIGPIYSSGKIEDNRKHNYTQGYSAPLTRERKEEQVKLVQKYFQREKQATDFLQKKIVDKAESLRKQYAPRAKSESRTDSKISREEALKLGEVRRQEALQRRQEFLSAKSETSKTETTTQVCKESFQILKEDKINPPGLIHSTDSSTLQTSVKSRRQLEMERDNIIQQTIQQYRQESSAIAQRVKEEEERRMQMIKHENLRIEEESRLRVEQMKKVNEERMRIADEERRIEVEKQKRIEL